jgi:hypothetical protein
MIGLGRPWRLFLATDASLAMVVWRGFFSTHNQYKKLIL